MEQQLIESASSYGFIGICLICLGLFIRSYIKKHDEYVERQDKIQQGLVENLMVQLTNQTNIMNELKNSITELTTIMKGRNDDLR